MRLLVRELIGPASVQDAGRPGYRRFGVPPSGAFDRLSLAHANALLGNAPEDPALEMGGGAVFLEALDGGDVGWAGAPCVPRLNGLPLEGTLARLKPGDLLRFDPPETGLRYYVALSGGVDAPLSLGSRSGWAPARGDTLSSLSQRPASPPLAVAALDLSDPAEIHVALGPQAGLFDTAGFGEGTYQVSSRIDRVGVRLEGPSLGEAPEIVSEPCFFGSVQVARSGQPIILGPDGPTVGGYPKVAQVLSEDLGRVAQLRPGASVRFLWV